MGIIHKLDSHLTNMIAAGEVVERPMGIVKELIENSIDANATSIEIRVENGGIDLIEIIDDGKGMDEIDALMAFERHATSKIKEHNDLWNIHTLGFRGEALPSIASVSKVNLITNDGHGGHHVRIEYGELQEKDAISANEGTSIEVSGLFYKTPARLKHLKSGAYENSLIHDLVTKFAFSHPEIAFTLTTDGRLSLKTNGSGNLLEVIYMIYGKDMAKSAIEVDVSDFDYHITGYLMHPQYTRANKLGIQFTLNHRLIRSYNLNKCMSDAYYDYIPKDRFPIAILNIDMDSRLLDINVHPSKWEVRLSKQLQLEQLVKDGCLNALNKQMKPFVIEVEKPKNEKVEQNVLFNTLEEVKPQNIPERVQTVIENMVEDKPEIVYEAKKEVVRAFPEMRLIGQMHGKFLLCEGETGLYVIDQHAAQERVHYEEIIDALNTECPMVDLLLPLSFKVGTDIVDRVDDLNKSCKEVQVEFEIFGNDRLIVRSIPIWMQQVDEEAFIKDLIDYFKEEIIIHRHTLQQHRIATMACHSSIRFNRVLTPIEMQEVIDQLKKCHQPFQCPHGRPTFVLLEDKILEREFLR